jgi:hypothetical protein
MTFSSAPEGLSCCAKSAQQVTEVRFSSLFAALMIRAPLAAFAGSFLGWRSSPRRAWYLYRDASCAGRNPRRRRTRQANCARNLCVALLGRSARCVCRLPRLEGFAQCRVVFAARESSSDRHCAMRVATQVFRNFSPAGGDIARRCSITACRLPAKEHEATG